MTPPLPAYRFQVEWGGTRVGFSEVSGLSTEITMIEYREGTSAESTPIKVPGLQKHGDVTLKRGIVEGDNELFEWFAAVRVGGGARDVRVSLLGDDHQPLVIWKLRNARPVKLSGPPLDATESEIAIEELVISYEGLVVENG